LIQFADLIPKVLNFKEEANPKIIPTPCKPKGNLNATIMLSLGDDY
jgi:hypothetical protein